MKNNICLFIFSLLTPFLFIQCSTSKTISAAEKNKETIMLWMEEGWNQKKYDSLIERCYAVDWRDGSPLRPDQLEGLEGIRSTVKGYITAFPDIQLKPTHVVVENNIVAIRLEITATHLGDAFGIPATGKKIETSSITIYEMENSKIKITWQEFDLMGLLNQLK